MKNSVDLGGCYPPPWSSAPVPHYELQCYENPMKMSFKTQESIFQGHEYRYFIFMAYFSGPEFSMKRW